MPAAQHFMDALGLSVPIVQAPIGPAATPQLVNAVAARGGLGMLAGSALGAEQLAAALAQIAPENRPRCGVNLINAMPGDDILTTALSAGIKIISFFWGLDHSAVTKAKEAGATVMQTIGSPAEVRPAIQAGADIIVAQGWEAGGHVWGTISTMALVPAAIEAAGAVPVLAAGGIASQRSMAAALALGAAGVWVGTRFLASNESGAHPSYKERLVQASSQDTFHGVLYDVGWPNAPARSLMNSTARAWQAAGSKTGDARPGTGEIIAHDGQGGPIPRYFVDIPTAETTGIVEGMAHYAGQCVSDVTNILPAGQIIDQMLVEA